MIATKQMDLRANIKKYFDLAFNGETIVVSRKENKNVVVISEQEYNELQRAISEEAIFYPFGTNLRTLVTNARVGGLEEAKFAPIYTFGDYSKLTLK